MKKWLLLGGLCWCALATFIVWCVGRAAALDDKWTDPRLGR